MTPDIAQFLRNMLANATLNVGADDFPQVSAMAVEALTQLDKIIGGGTGNA